MADRRIVYGFRIAGAINIAGMLVFTQGLTDDTLARLYPGVFSIFSVVLIGLWGAAYIAASANYPRLGGLVLVFAAEKFLYVGTWIYWLRAHGAVLGATLEREPMAGVFMATYGIADGLIGIFFLLVGINVLRRSH